MTQSDHSTPVASLANGNDHPRHHLDLNDFYRGERGTNVSKRQWLKARILSVHFLVSCIVFAVVEGLIIGYNLDLQWQWLVIYAWLMVALNPIAFTPETFFKGDLTSTDTSTWSFSLLSSSAFISWIFAKSIYNASDLGAKYGIIGGLAYAGWYTSFVAVAAVVYRLRKLGYNSLPEAINHRYGNAACFWFLLTVLYRLYQEIWSNSLVVASFYGDVKSTNWWWAAVMSTAVPLAYTLMGGMRSSLTSDFFQAGVAIAFLITILAVVCDRAQELDCSNQDDRSHCNLLTWNPVPGRNKFSLQGGMDLLTVALIQGTTSYGFMDPVLTDRAFLVEPRRMVKAFVSGGFVAACFIVLFSLLGVYGNMLSVLGDDQPYDDGVGTGNPVDVARTLSTAMYSLINIVFITSSISTLDSTFACVSKLMGPEITGFLFTGRPRVLSQAKMKDMAIGRMMMVFIAIVGTLTLITEQTALNATTISGTVVMGIGPPIWGLAVPQYVKGYRPLCWHVPYWLGVCLGIAYSVGNSHPDRVNLSVLRIGDGGYANLLGWNLTALVLCWASFGLALMENFKGEGLPSDETRRWHELPTTDVAAVKEIESIKTFSKAVSDGSSEYSGEADGGGDGTDTKKDYESSIGHAERAAAM